jgi:GNAT superfamily N-acetyltransferase
MTLQSIDADPACAIFSVATPQNAILRPLCSTDEEDLAAFFAQLSDRTRRFYSVTDPGRQAYEHCAAIARYDKLRLVLQNQTATLALVEFSFDLTADDVARFANHGRALLQERACRWGLCVADEWQGRGVGRALAGPSFEIARRFGRDRIILWGGVHAHNEPAIRYYRKIGFSESGAFTNDDGVECIDMVRPSGI